MEKQKYLLDVIELTRKAKESVPELILARAKQTIEYYSAIGHKELKIYPVIRIKNIDGTADQNLTVDYSYLELTKNYLLAEGFTVVPLDGSYINVSWEVE